MKIRMIVIAVMTAAFVTGVAAEDLVSVPKLVYRPVAAIRAALPDGWSIKEVADNASPMYCAEGSGQAIFIASPRQASGETSPDFEAAVYIMPPDYNDGGVKAEGMEGSVQPAQLITVTENEKVYLWTAPDIAAAGWEPIKDDILKAIIYTDE
ncbi:MAG: hypothetical protein WCY23_01405 [Candidatus Omnitrophota bacterium]